MVVELTLSDALPSRLKGPVPGIIDLIVAATTERAADICRKARVTALNPSSIRIQVPAMIKMGVRMPSAIVTQARYSSNTTRT